MDPYSGIFRWAWKRATHRLRTFLWGTVMFATFSGVLDAFLGHSRYATNWQEAAHGAIVGVVAATALIALLTIYYLARAPFEQRQELRQKVEQLLDRFKAPELVVEGRSPRPFRDGNQFMPLSVTNRGARVGVSAWVEAPVIGIKENEYGGLFLGWTHDALITTAILHPGETREIYTGAYLVRQEAFRFHLPGNEGPGRWGDGKSIHPLGDWQFTLVLRTPDGTESRWVVEVPFDSQFRNFKPMRPTPEAP